MLETIGAKIGRVGGILTGIWLLFWTVTKTLAPMAESLEALVKNDMDIELLLRTSLTALALAGCGVLIFGAVYILIKDTVNLVIEVMKIVMNNRQLQAAIVAYKEAELEKLKAENNKVTTVNFIKSDH